MRKVIFTIDKKILKKMIISTTSCASKCDSNLLQNVQIIVQKNILIMHATDGNRLIETKFEGENTGTLKNIEILVNAYILSKLNFSIMSSDLITIEISKDEIAFKDLLSGIKYNIEVHTHAKSFPNCQLLFEQYEYKKNKHTIALNRNFLENLKTLITDERNQIVKINMNKDNALSPVIVETLNKGYGIKQKCLIMPILTKD